jgi:metal-responsive CopG/Arc/MetJ family transcriptional regulator
MFNGTIKLKKDLLQRVERCAKAGGYSSPQEFVEHIIERELAKLEDAQSDEEIVKKLKGLGYID